MCLVKLRKVEDEEDDLRVRVRRRSHHSQTFPHIPPPAVVPIPAPQPRPLFVQAIEPRRRSRIERDVQIVHVSPSTSEGSIELVHHPRRRSRSRRRESGEEVVFEERRDVRYERERSPDRLETYRYVNAPDRGERSRSRRRSVSRHSRQERHGDRDEYEDDVRVKVKRSYRD